MLTAFLSLECFRIFNNFDWFVEDAALVCLSPPPRSPQKQARFKVELDPPEDEAELLQPAHKAFKHFLLEMCPVHDEGDLVQ